MSDSTGSILGLVVVVGIIGFVILIAWLLLNQNIINPYIFMKEGDECKVSGGDPNGVYFLNDKKECVMTKCSEGWYMDINRCVEKRDFDSQDGVESKDCIISGYNSGQCKRDGKTLTGYDDLYGDGSRGKIRNCEFSCDWSWKM